MLSKKLPGEVNEQNRQDALQEICISVLKGLAVFLNKFVDKTPEQRQKWLYRITQRRIADIVAKNYVTEERMDAFGRVENVNVYRTDSLDDENSIEPTSREYSIDKLYFDKYASEWLVKAFSELMKQDIALDRLMSFFYSKIIIPIKVNRYTGTTFSGKVQEAVDLLNGRRMEDIVKAFPEDLHMAYDVVFPAKMFKVLDRKLLEECDAKGMLWKDVTFSLEYNKVLDASNRLMKRFKRILEKQEDSE